MGSIATHVRTRSRVAWHDPASRTPPASGATWLCRAKLQPPRRPVGIISNRHQRPATPSLTKRLSRQQTAVLDRRFDGWTSRVVGQLSSLQIQITHVSVNRPPTAATQRATVLMTFDRDLYRLCRHNGTSIGAYLSAPRKRPALSRYQNGETVTSGAPSFTTDRDRNEAKETFGARRRGLVARRPPPKRHGRHCNRHSYQYLSSGRAL
jgi:hypothetical protein